jgi:hypothetical protein
VLGALTWSEGVTSGYYVGRTMVDAKWASREQRRFVQQPENHRGTLNDTYLARCDGMEVLGQCGLA